MTFIFNWDFIASLLEASRLSLQTCELLLAAALLPSERYKAISIMHPPLTPPAPLCLWLRLLKAQIPSYLSPDLKHIASFQGVASFPVLSSGIGKGARGQREPSGPLLPYTLHCPFSPHQNAQRRCDDATEDYATWSNRSGQHDQLSRGCLLPFLL